MKTHYRDDLYFEWLVNEVDGDSIRGFLRLLFDIPFRWSVDYDENRAKNCLKIRENFGDVFNKSPPSVLEVVLSLAMDMENVLYIPGENHTSDYFIELLHNSKWLEEYVLDSIPGDRNENVKNLVTDWIDRKYDRFGRPGLFPLKNPNCVDQRKTELWYQMHAYILEKLEKS